MELLGVQDLELVVMVLELVVVVDLKNLEQVVVVDLKNLELVVLVVSLGLL